MKQRISDQEISQAFKTLLNDTDLIDNNDTSLIMYDVDFLSSRIDALKTLFPENTIHAIAVKANPLIKILKKFKHWGVGLETASLPELYIAEKIGLEPQQIVFDSPSKTVQEIEYALKLGAHINADSFNELARIDQLIKAKHKSNQRFESAIGLRINPQVGSGSIKTTSVADKISKFGVPIEDHRDEIIQTYLKYPWLNGIHLHIGSQGISINQLLDGLKKVYELTEQINLELKKYNRAIRYFDLGGGFPVSYCSNTSAPQLSSYIDQAKANHPQLFSADYRLITEFGRYINANSAWAISRVEYVKDESTYKILSIHLGADFMLRTAYNPQDWQHELTIVDKHGNPKSGTDTKPYIVAGPLCFAGDIIAKDLELPIVEEGDYVVIHDVGGYTTSMWSRYNSRQMPKIIAYSPSTNQQEIIKHRETLDDLYDFWQ